MRLELPMEIRLFVYLLLLPARGSPAMGVQPRGKMLQAFKGENFRGFMGLNGREKMGGLRSSTLLSPGRTMPFFENKLLPTLLLLPKTKYSL